MPAAVQTALYILMSSALLILQVALHCGGFNQNCKSIKMCFVCGYVLVFYASQCEVLLGSVFATCHGYISPNIYQQQCRYQACRCGSSCLCTALAHYALLCSKHGVSINFRSHVSECGECLATGLLLLMFGCVSNTFRCIIHNSYRLKLCHSVCIFVQNQKDFIIHHMTTHTI